ncbi:MAG TPA: DNA-binding response regulator [Thermodesulfovibrionales bacterium]|nr:DNA-binding response regulator [Thermodesulfovibrionales bacterium]
MKNEILVMDCEDRGTFWLTLRSDYKILFATTAEEGLGMLSEKVALVFLSMRLPDMKSMEVFRLIKEKYPSTAVIIITACATEETAIEPFRKEGGDYAKRPLDAEDLLRKIKALVGVDDDARKQQDTSLLVGMLQDEQYPDIPPHIVEGILKVRDFVARNYSESLSLTAACRMASVSKTYFCHFFKRITGHSLRSYQHAVKIQMAGRLLADSRVSVKEVARRLGYHDPNYFSTVYRKVTGIPPKQLRAHIRGLEGKPDAAQDQ